MTWMTGLVADDDGTPLPGVYVAAELVGSKWLAGRGGQVDGHQDTFTGRDGVWRLDLLPMVQLEDPRAYWKVRVWQRATFGLDVPPPPADGGPVPISTPGVLREIEQPPPPGGDYVTGADFRAHVRAPEPHPAYDDLPSLVLIYENGLI